MSGELQAGEADRVTLRFVITCDVYFVQEHFAGTYNLAGIAHKPAKCTGS